MFDQKLKTILEKSISWLSANIDHYSSCPEKDFSRVRKLPPEKLIPHLLSQGSSSSVNELLDFFCLSANTPTLSALNQQRNKLKPEAFQTLFMYFNASIEALNRHSSDYRFIAVDGSTFSFFSKPSFHSFEYFVEPGHSMKGFYSVHVNAFYDLETQTYTNALTQPVHQKDEFGAFCTMVDMTKALPDTKYVFIGDRGYCSYNNMAHTIEKGQYFLFRTKDIHSKGLVKNFDRPNDASFDMDVTVTIVRSHSKKVVVQKGYTRFIDANSSFDFVAYGSHETYEMTFRVVRFLITETTYECMVTNLPRDEFPAERLKELYNARWGVESSFRQLKYTIGLSHFHSYKPKFVLQEIWAKLLSYNVTALLINHTKIEETDTKHTYKVSFSVAAHVAKTFLRSLFKDLVIDVFAILKCHLMPIREGRKFERLKTAHFRRPKYFIYRPS